MKKRIKKYLSDIGFLWQFSLDDFKKKYAGSVGGVAWAVLQPLFTVALYWFVFQVGLKSGSVTQVPFILWLIAGLLPWLFISETITNSMSALVDYSYLVKKIRFNINILPLIKIVSGLMVHLILVGIMVLMYIGYGLSVSLYYLQTLFYLAYTVLLVAGIAYLTCTMYAFVKDILQIVSLLLQAFFWTTPIVWQLDIMGENIQKIVRLSPFYYIVSGYRDCFINHVWFWERGAANLYYWFIAVGFLALGVYTFSKCRRHFADVL